MGYGESLPLLDISDRQALSPAVGFVVLSTMPDQLMPQLVDKSLEENIIKNTPKDRERFPSVDHIRAKIDSGTEIYPLVQLASEPSDDSLAGVMWLHESGEHIRHGNYTLAIRVYEGFEGKGLAASLMTTVLSEHRRRRPAEQKIWLGVNASNNRAQALYDRFGFHIVERSATRFIMSASL